MDNIWRKTKAIAEVFRLYYVDFSRRNSIKKYQIPNTKYQIPNTHSNV